MKLKNIFLVFVLGTIWGFSSCSSEEVIDTPENGEATLSISLSVNDIQTKAGEQIATSEELQISNCHIAIFDNEEGSTNGKFITSFDFSTGNGLSGDNNQYTCTAQKIRTFGNARKVKFLAIANIDKTINQLDLDNVSGKSYTEYLNAVVTSSSFNSTGLVKVGEKALLIEKDESYSIQIGLTQLTARFDFEGITIGGGGTASKAASSGANYKYEFLNTAELNEHQDLKNKMGKSFYSGYWKDNCFYNGYYNSERVIGIKITKTTSQSSETQFSDTKVWGINKRSTIGAYKDEDNNASEFVEGVVFDKKFYTYKHVSDNLKVTVVKKSTNQSVFYGYMYQSYNWSLSWSPELNELSPTSDVYDKSDSKIQIQNINWGNSGSQGETFTLDLSKVDFENGKRYIIKGTYNPTVNTGIDWVVQDWSSKENINIGFN